MLKRKLARLKDLYLEGDVDREAYQAQKRAITADLATLPTTGTVEDQTVGERLASFLADVSRAWAIASPEERNRIARQLFGSVVVTNRTAVAVVPRPDLEPFFVTVAVNPDANVCTGGSDGDPLRRCTLASGAILFASAPERRRMGHSQRDTFQQPRSRRLSPQQQDEINLLARSQSLRSLAAEFGVSHETIRSVLRR